MRPESRITETWFSCWRAMARGDEAAAQAHWVSHIGLLEVEMGRTGSPQRLTDPPKQSTQQEIK